jgi:hypothetical protein
VALNYHGLPLGEPGVSESVKCEVGKFSQDSLASCAPDWTRRQHGKFSPQHIPRMLPHLGKAQVHLTYFRHRPRKAV